jgi:Meiotically up-regulated gene 113
MRQQIYVISSANGLVKIGLSTAPDMRVRELQRANGYELSLVQSWPVPKGQNRRVERCAHAKLAIVRGFGEWFNCSVEEAIGAVEYALARPVSPKKKPLMRTPGSRDEMITINVKGVRVSSWNAARAEVKRLGMTMGAYLTMVIQQECESDGIK